MTPDEKEAFAPEFSRPLAVETLRRRDGADIRETATEAECAALAARYGAMSVSHLEVTARIRPGRDGLWRASGEVHARLDQICVVTLEAAPAEITEAFIRDFHPDAEGDGVSDDIDPDAEDPPEHLGEEIDIGEIAAETVALALDPYPHAPGAAFEGAAATPPGAEPLDSEALRPFAGLAALKARMEDGGAS